MDNTIKSYFMDKKVNDLFIYFEKVIKKGYEKYNGLSKFFDKEYETDCSIEAQSVRKGLRVIVDCYKNAMMFYGTVGTSSSNSYVDIIMIEMGEIQKILREQANLVISNLENIKGGDLIKTLIT